MFDGLKSEIEYLRDIKTHYWVAFLASFGASVGIMFVYIPTLLKLIMTIIGFMSSAVFFMNYFKKGVMIEHRINFLKKKGE